MCKKIKRLTVCLILIGSSFTASLAQLPKALYGTPDRYQGYFVFDAINNPDVTSWVVDIFQVVEGDDSTKSYSKQVDRVSIKEQSFLKFDNKYFNSNDVFEVSVNGINSNGVVVAEDFWEYEPPHSGIYWSEVCGANCEGKTYAYRVSLNAQQLNGQVTGNTHRIELTGTAEDVDTQTGYYLPYYRDMSDIEKENMCQHGGNNDENSHLNWNTPKHYGYLQCPYEDGINFFKENGVIINDGLKDKDGTTLQGTVWRVAKTRGYWSNQSSLTNYHSELQPVFAEDKCGELMTQSTAQRILGFTNYANDLLTLDNTLFCDGFYSSGSSGGSPSPVKPAYSKIKGTYIWWNVSGGSNGGIGELFDFLEEAASQLPSDIINNTGAPWWPSDSIFAMKIYKLDVDADNIPDGPIVEYRKDELFEPNGAPKNTNLTLDRGLYNLLFSFSDGMTLPIIFDVKEKMVSSYNLSNYLDVVIFPVPITEENMFNLVLDATATLKFDYYIYDENGNELFNRNIVMHKGHERVIKIPTRNLPSGLLFHKFVFEDNSEINKTTIKN